MRDYTHSSRPVPGKASQFNRARLWAFAAALLLAPIHWALPQDSGAKELLEQLRTYQHQIVCETHRDGNWELYLMNADGSDAVNLTLTPDVDELYPKASPDGKRICFIADEGQGKDRSRNLYVMNRDGTGRTKFATNAREPCWSASSTQIAYLPGEIERFTYSDYATKGLRIYDLKSGKTREHPNKKIHHLYTLNWSANGKWFVSTVHGGMGFRHAIIALEADGDGVYNLKLGGCRPDLSPDGKMITWGDGDYAIGLANIDFSTTPPKVSNIRHAVKSKSPLETYHADWSPDGKYVCFSFGPKFKGKNLKGLLPEFPGVVAPGWDICVADASPGGRQVKLTSDGKSNKEGDWVFTERTTR